MTSHKISHYIKYIGALLVFAMIIMIGLYAGANANLQYKGQGFAYGSISDDGDQNADTGIGFLSFGCTDGGDNACEDTSTTNFPSGYGVRINTNPDSSDYGKIFGYAWSSNYGWVSFYHNDVAQCGPEGGLEINGDVQEVLSQPNWGQILSGYARVLNHDEDSWNGCISFSGTTTGNQEYSTKILREDSEVLQIRGWAWGSDVVGWVSFECQECRVLFIPQKEEECNEADDPEVCDTILQSGLALYVGPSTGPTTAIIGNTTYTAQTTDISESLQVRLIPQAFDNSVGSCDAVATSNLNAVISGWSGILSDLNPLQPNTLSNQYLASISNYQIGEIVTFNITCVAIDEGESVTAQAFVTIQYPEPSVSITANPNPIDIGLDPSGSTTLSWNFSNVDDNTCAITGVVDFTPTDGSDGLAAIDETIAQDILFDYNFNGPPNLQSPGGDDLQGIINFPVAFTITCEDFAGQNVSDSVYITTTDIGCTESMEAAGWCSNDINPIFEEF